ncbi:uncharacterized protein [Chelonus insularis]|uniref:uncharacterized protein isoform X4 n=1 Tax=Chelonus insularis TaxID=460826 RepID=UPI00158F39F7|nr:uncharacterized protein LOC118064087 isoform X4 [Chelonus insularis]
MLCCVSRKAVGGSVITKKPPLIPPKEKLSNSSTLESSTTAKLHTPASNFPSEKAENLKTKPSDSILANEDETSVLLPCAICSRTFKPQSLEKHVKICERTATKKRKPFDSAKQRIQGTELEEFLPVEQKKKILQEEKRHTSWKQNHDDFIKTIRAARGDSGDTISCRQTTSIVAPGAPTRANEKGLCPTCNRQFGIKAYDRHVAWCKERIVRAPASPATNVAKERLDARMKYRAPLLKNRRMTNREKYAPHSGIKNNSSSNSKAKESQTSLNCNKVNESLSIKQPAVTERRKGGQGKTDSVIASGPVKSRLSDRITNGVCQDYDPFLMADRQLNELLSDTCSDQSFLDSPSTRYKPTSTPLYPHSHSSAFVKYPNSSPSNSPDKKGSFITPPSEFDELSICFSSDSTDTNSICRELFPDLESPCRREDQNKNKSNQPILGRRVIIDKSKALGTPNVDTFDDNLNRNNNNTFQKSRQVVEKVTTKCIRPQVTRSNSVRAASAPKIPERNSVLSNKVNSRSSSSSRFQNKSNNYANLNGSNLSLSSIVSSEVEVKRSNSMFDDLVSSFEDESGSFPSLRSYLKDDSLSLSSSLQTSRVRNGQISDEDLSSPDSYKRPDNKLSADSAYSSLNRKYSNHGHDATDMTNRIDEDVIRRRENEVTSTAKSKMSKFCHECGTRFPETAKFCCECGIQRLAL